LDAIRNGDQVEEKSKNEQNSLKIELDVIEGCVS
jgi:hypothetical protein